MSALDRLEETLQWWGVPVIVDTVPGRPGTFVPTHVMVHHTASQPPAAAPSAKVVREGRGDLPGPLCHLLVRRDFRVELVTRGKANHAGLGGPWGGIPEDNGNSRCVGIEIEHAGTAAEEWTPQYMAFCRRVCAATLSHIGAPATRLLAHKEWAPDRKIDPYHWAMDFQRREVARLLADGPNPPTTLLEDIMADPKERAALVKDIADEVLNRPLPLGKSARDVLGVDRASLAQLAQWGTALAKDNRAAVGRVETDLADGVTVEPAPPAQA